MPVLLPRPQLVVVFALVVALSALAAPPAQAHYGPTRWDCLAHYESTHRWHINSGNGHYGGLQFSRSTWRYYGGPRYSGNRWPHRASRREQVVIAKRTAWRGWRGRAAQGGRNAWPNTWRSCF
ncbi:MAG TPA: transglycosylase family protein [Nocardioidaceae bacterium]|nr:transglycosylase family protein [Nocardioidaceae bacterium]